MPNKRDFRIVFLFLFILLFFNTVYFFIYFKYLDLSFPLMNLFFVVSGTMSLFLMLNFFRSKLWHVFCYFLMLAFYFWALINFAYFQVFKTFVDFGSSKISQLNLSLLEMLKDFYFLIPFKLYIFTAIVFILVIAASVFYNSLAKRKIEKVKFFSQQYTFISVKNHGVGKVLLFIFLFSVLNFSALQMSNYFTNNPKEIWWDIKEQVQDFGVWGHFYNQVNAQTDSRYDDSSQSFLQLTKQAYSNINKTQNYKNSSEIHLPVFENQPNILIIQLESVGGWAVNNNPTPMPFLKSLINENISIPHFHANSCETINAEFASMCSFWPNSFEPIGISHQDNQFYCLPQILDEQYGYDTYFFHSNVSEFWNRDVLNPKWGYEYNFQTPYFRQKEADKFVFEKALNILEKSQKPFLGYVLSFTSHSPHNEYAVLHNKNANDLIIEPFTGAINPEFKNVEISEEEVRLYYGFLTAVDDALKQMFNNLQVKRMLDDTVVLIYNDHRYYDFLSDELIDFYNYNEMPFVMVLPNKQQGQLQNIASHLDIAPTILNMIQQNNYLPQSHFAGTSLFSKNFKNNVLNKCLGKIYFANNDLVIQGNAKTGQYRLFNSDKDLTTIEQKNWLSLIDELVEQSDNTIYNDQLVDLD